MHVEKNLNLPKFQRDIFATNNRAHGDKTITRVGVTTRPLGLQQNKRSVNRDGRLLADGRSESRLEKHDIQLTLQIL